MTETHENDEQIYETICERASGDGQYAIAWALLKVAEGQEQIANTLRWMATGDVSIPGVLEKLSMQLEEVGQQIGGALGEIAEAQRERTERAENAGR